MVTLFFIQSKDTHLCLVCPQPHQGVPEHHREEILFSSFPMIILFILYSVFLHNDVLAGPLQPIPFYPHEIDPSRFTQRSVWNIFWSCLATLFVCSWVAVHPNIPAPSDRIFITRLKIMGCMLIMPELVIVWAGRQWYAAHHIADRHKGLYYSFFWILKLF